MSIVTETLSHWAVVIMLALLMTVVGPLLDDSLDPTLTEAEVAEAVAADLADAIAQAQSERPDLWDAEARARAHESIAIAARHAAAAR